MTDLISRQAVLDIADDLRDRMTVEGYCAMVERVKALPSATCGNLEKPEIPQHSEGEAADCNLDCISRQMLLEYIHGEPVGKLLCDKYNLDGLIEQFPSAQPERKTGRWIHDGYAFKGGIDWMHCSECGHKDIWSAVTRTPFCAWCGARMEGES
jgi:hypothetical protein